jgi:hypothetical protein
MPRESVHGISPSTWESTVRDFTDPTARAYPFYGGSGFKMHAPWLTSFDTFVRDVVAEIGPRPEGLWLGRIDKTGDLKPGNIKWATATEHNNGRRSNKQITFRGRTQSAAEWGAELGIPRQQIANRLNRGWSVEEALTTPVEDTSCVLEIDGTSRTITEWAALTGRPRTTIANRLRRGLDAKAAVFGDLASRTTDGTCPSCKTRPKHGADSYCRECRRAYNLTKYHERKSA